MKESKLNIISLSSILILAFVLVDIIINPSRVCSCSSNNYTATLMCIPALNKPPLYFEHFLSTFGTSIIFLTLLLLFNRIINNKKSNNLSRWFILVFYFSFLGVILFLDFHSLEQFLAGVFGVIFFIIFFWKELKEL